LRKPTRKLRRSSGCLCQEPVGYFGLTLSQLADEIAENRKGGKVVRLGFRAARNQIEPIVLVRRIDLVDVAVSFPAPIFVSPLVVELLVGPVIGVNGFKPYQDLISDKPIICVDCVAELKDCGHERRGFDLTTEPIFRVFGKTLRSEIVVEESVLQMLQQLVARPP